MILSLVLASVVFVPVVGFIGVSSVGVQLFGTEPGAMLATANTTFNAVYAGFGVSFLVPLLVFVVILFVAVIVTLGKSRAAG